MPIDWLAEYRSGIVARRAQQFDAAERHLRAACAECERSGAPQRKLALCLRALSSLLSMARANDPRQKEGHRLQTRADRIISDYRTERLAIAESRYDATSARLIPRLLRLGRAVGMELYNARHWRTETKAELDSHYQRGRAVLLRARALAESSFGPLDERTTQTMSTLANFYSFFADRPQRALPLLRNRLRRFLRMFGRDHHNFRHALWKVAFCLNECSKGARAAHILERVLKMDEKATDRRSSPGNTHSMLALIYERIGEKKQALRHQRQSLELDKKVRVPSIHAASTPEAWRSVDGCEAVPQSGNRVSQGSGTQ